MTRWVAVMLVTMALAGCRGPGGTPVIPATDLLTVSERAKGLLPGEAELTLATEADVHHVSRLSPEVVRTVEQFLKPCGRKSRIVAARPVGHHLLLWVCFPEVKDGGIDLIYSLEKKRVVGTFFGGERG